jgi:hypothetical protein
MKYSVAKSKANEFCRERKETIRIAKSNKLEDYCLLFGNEEPTKNHKVVEVVEKGKEE